MNRETVNRAAFCLEMGSLRCWKRLMLKLSFILKHYSTAHERRTRTKTLAACFLAGFLFGAESDEEKWPVREINQVYTVQNQFSCWKMNTIFKSSRNSK